MFYLLSIAAGASFIAHVSLLLASFGRSHFYSGRYLYSHVTLWITGLILFVMTLLFQGKGISAFIDYFATQVRKGMILLVTLVLSLVAHVIVKRLTSDKIPN